MKKLLMIIVFGAAVTAGYLFLTNSSNNSAGQDTGGNVADSGILSVENQSKSNDHIRSAIKKQTLDRTGTQKVSVDIGDFFFDPTVLKVKNGTTVTWTNSGMVGHDVKTDPSSPKRGPNSAMLNTGDSYSFTFDELGLYLYFCSPHPVQMRAVIEVVE